MIMESGVSDIIKNCADFIMNQTSFKMVKAARLRWLGHLYRTEELNPCKKRTFSKQIGTRKKGRPPVRWLDNVQQDLQTLGVRNWK
jgi:hypothetical protein